MGKGHQKKREEQHETKQNAVLEQEMDDLIARVPPVTERRIELVSSTDGLGRGDALTARVSKDGKLVEFRRGESVCGTTDLAIAEELDVVLEGTLFEVVSHEDQILSLRVLPVDRKRFRPPVDDDD